MGYRGVVLFLVEASKQEAFTDGLHLGVSFILNVLKHILGILGERRVRSLESLEGVKVGVLLASRDEFVESRAVLLVGEEVTLDGRDNILGVL